MSKLPSIGAEIEAAVIIATVPDPWISRTNVAIKKGISTAGTLHVTTSSAITVPAPLSLNTAPNAPPAPVTSRIIPALFRPTSNSFSVSSTVNFLAKVNNENNRPSATAIIGLPKNVI